MCKLGERGIAYLPLCREIRGLEVDKGVDKDDNAYPMALKMPHGHGMVLGGPFSLLLPPLWGLLVLERWYVMCVWSLE